MILVSSNIYSFLLPQDRRVELRQPKLRNKNKRHSFEPNILGTFDMFTESLNYELKNKLLLGKENNNNLFFFSIKKNKNKLKKKELFFYLFFKLLLKYNYLNTLYRLVSKYLLRWIENYLYLNYSVYLYIFNILKKYKKNKIVELLIKNLNFKFLVNNLKNKKNVLYLKKILYLKIQKKKLNLKAYIIESIKENRIKVSPRDSYLSIFKYRKHSKKNRITKEYHYLGNFFIYPKKYLSYINSISKKYFLGTNNNNILTTRSEYIYLNDLDRQYKYYMKRNMDLLNKFLIDFYGLTLFDFKYYIKRFIFNKNIINWSDLFILLESKINFFLYRLFNVNFICNNKFIQGNNLYIKKNNLNKLNIAVNNIKINETNLHLKITDIIKLKIKNKYKDLNYIFFKNILLFFYMVKNLYYFKKYIFILLYNMLFRLIINSYIDKIKKKMKNARIKLKYFHIFKYHKIHDLNISTYVYDHYIQKYKKTIVKIRDDYLLRPDIFFIYNEKKHNFVYNCVHRRVLERMDNCLKTIGYNRDSIYHKILNTEHNKKIEKIKYYDEFKYNIPYFLYKLRLKHNYIYNVHDYFLICNPVLFRYTTKQTYLYMHKIIINQLCYKKFNKFFFFFFFFRKRQLTNLPLLLNKKIKKVPFNEKVTLKGENLLKLLTVISHKMNRYAYLYKLRKLKFNINVYKFFSNQLSLIKKALIKNNKLCSLLINKKKKKNKRIYFFTERSYSYKRNYTLGFFSYIKRFERFIYPLLKHANNTFFKIEIYSTFYYKLIHIITNNLINFNTFLIMLKKRNILYFFIYEQPFLELVSNLNNKIKDKKYPLSTLPSIHNLKNLFK